jgi:hypothetical protein
MRCEFVTGMLINVVVVWDGTFWSMEIVRWYYRRFGGMYRFLQGLELQQLFVDFYTQKTDTVRCSETPVTVCHSTWRDIQEGLRLRCEMSLIIAT